MVDPVSFLNSAPCTWSSRTSAISRATTFTGRRWRKSEKSYWTCPGLKTSIQTTWIPKPVRMVINNHYLRYGGTTFYLHGHPGKLQKKSAHVHPNFNITSYNFELLILVNLWSPVNHVTKYYISLCKMSCWSTRPTTVPADSDHYIHYVFTSPLVNIDQNKTDLHCRLGLWACRVDHWLLLSSRLLVLKPLLALVMFLKEKSLTTCYYFAPLGVAADVFWKIAQTWTWFFQVSTRFSIFEMCHSTLLVQMHFNFLHYCNGYIFSPNSILPRKKTHRDVDLLLSFWFSPKNSWEDEISFLIPILMVNQVHVKYHFCELVTLDIAGISRVMDCAAYLNFCRAKRKRHSLKCY